MGLSPLLRILGLTANFIALASAAPSQSIKVLEARDSGEHIGLFDCRNGDYLTSRVAYFKAGINGSPDDQAYASAPDGQWHHWEGGSGQQVTFASGVSFSWNIPSFCPVNSVYAGSGNNGFGDLQCYYDKDVASYTTADGTVCTSVYLCDHSVTSGQGCTRTAVSFDVSADYTELPEDWQTSAHDMLAKVYDHIDAGSTLTLASTVVDFGNGVSITFEGLGAVPGKTLYGAAMVLVESMGSTQGISQTWQTTSQVCVDVNSCCNTDDTVRHPCGTRCCRYGPVSHNQFKMARTATVSIINTAIDSNGQNSGNPSVQGWLKYTLQYAPPQPDCGLLGIFTTGLKAASIIPRVEEYLGPVETVAEIVGGIVGC